ncbi:MAG: DUF983 domain-containing protein [Bdellovibrionota bacterium]
MGTPEQVRLRTALSRGLRRRCPRCGKGKVFEGWYREVGKCAECGLSFERRAGDSWAFLYLTTAAFVAPVAFAVLILRQGGRWFSGPVIAAILAAFIIASLPVRKSVALALDYLVDQKDGASE